jgi:beta-lactamase class A
MRFPGLKFIPVFILLALIASACSSPTPTVLVLPSSTPASTNPATTILPTETAAPPTSTLPPTQLAEATPVPTSALITFAEPAGCRQPTSDTTKVSVNGFTINQRTYEMLQYAAQLYGGAIDVVNTAITQGSYSDNGPASFGTHLGGGAVDISVIRPKSYSVLYSEIPPLIRALRTAGFAAWLRDWNELAEGSEIHIHAVAIGDPELSPEAEEQLTGEAGYFRGYAGFLKPDGSLAPDHDGSPILCEWMIEAGYADLRPPEKQHPQPSTQNWMITLAEAANASVTVSHKGSVIVAHEIGYLASGQEDPSLMCGPLAAYLLQKASMLPTGIGPWNDLHNYWLADPETDGKPWSFFPAEDYSLYRYSTPLAKFDFNDWPLRPGDFLYTYAKGSGFEHMFVVTEVDEQGRAYTVANQYRGEQIGYLIERMLLYDPNASGEGAIYKEWQDPKLGRTGHDGFDVLRINGLSQPPGSLYEARVHPGDTVFSLAAKYFSTPEAIVTANPLIDVSRLELGSWVWVPVNLTGWGMSVVPDTVPEDAVETSLERHVYELVEAFPSGKWHIYIKNLKTDQVVAVNAEEPVHPASTIKVPISLALFTFLDQHPEITIFDGMPNSARSYEQLLNAMLIQSEEVATAELENFLRTTRDARPAKLVKEWGAEHTTFEPRLSTASDLGLLWEKLFEGKLLSPDSTQALLNILRKPSRGDDERIGAGLPEDIRLGLAHKTGTTFENNLGVVADTGVVETDQGAYVIVAVANGITSTYYETAKLLIAEVSRIAYNEFTLP